MSPVQPRLRIQLLLLLPQLEVEHGAAVVRTVGENLPDGLFGGDIIPLLDGGGREVAIDGNVVAMTDEDVEQAVQLEDRRHLAVEDGTRLRAGLALNIDALVVQLDIAQALHGILAVVTGDDIGIRNGYRQFASVVDEAAGKLAVRLAHGIGFQRSGGLFGSGSGRLARVLLFRLLARRGFTARKKAARLRAFSISSAIRRSMRALS